MRDEATGKFGDLSHCGRQCDVWRDDESQPCIEVVEACGEWHVRVVEDDREKTLTFELEAYALAFAEGQRTRLGLADFKRL